MCNKIDCLYALSTTGDMVDWCDFYSLGRNILPENCQIPFLTMDDDEVIIELTEEVKI